MTLDSIDDIRAAGFSGFRKIHDLMEDSSTIPRQRGVYMVLRDVASSVSFTVEGTGGFFKGKDPNVSLALLEANWVEGTSIVYIGKAGAVGSAATLQSRLRQYLKFGKGKNVGHWGGRLIWQIDGASELVMCWKPMPDGDPRAAEAAMIREFVAEHGKRPFANLSD